MMYTRDIQRQRFKRRALVILYLIFLLATAGEIFLTLNRKIEINLKKIEASEDIQIPLHLPEDGKVEFTRIKRQLHL